MASIFNLMESLRNITDIIEENGGEITDEMSAQYSISSKDFKDKCKSYAQTIQLIKADLALIKSEIERLNKLKKAKEKSIDFLNRTLVSAIEEFGNSDIKGKKLIDYGDKIISIRETKAVEDNKSLIDKAVNQLSINAAYFHEANMFSQSDSFDISEFVKNLDLPENTSVTSDNLNDVKIILSVETNLLDVLQGKGYKIISEASDCDLPISFSGKISKTEIKPKLMIDGETPFASIVTNKTVTIK